jgi:hypothetical protein
MGVKSFLEESKNQYESSKELEIGFRGIIGLV